MEVTLQKAIISASELIVERVTLLQSPDFCLRKENEKLVNNWVEYYGKCWELLNNHLKELA